MPKGIPLTAEDLERRRHEIFSASVHLFLEKGFQETSMREIAAAAGMGKSSLYDYFITKDEILLSVIEDDVDDLTGKVRIITDQALPAVEKLQQVMHTYLNYLLSKKAIFFKLNSEVQRLELQSQRRIQLKRHELQDLLSALIKDAIQEGSFRPVNPLLATRTILALLTPAAFTTRPTGTAEQMMDEAFDIFLRGVQA
jgi:TetR/AcrR family transcriptional regulator, cholesterol catabolism regulator